MKVYIRKLPRASTRPVRSLLSAQKQRRAYASRAEIPRVIFRQRTWPYMRILFSSRICMKFEKFSNKHGGNTAARKRAAVNGTFPFPLLAVRLRKSSSTSSSSRRSCKNLKPRAISRKRDGKREAIFAARGNPLIMV